MYRIESCFLVWRFENWIWYLLIVELQKQRQQVVAAIRSNQQLEKDATGMDIKIGLLVKNRITLEVCFIGFTLVIVSILYLYIVYLYLSIVHLYLSIVHLYLSIVHLYLSIVYLYMLCVCLYIYIYYNVDTCRADITKRVLNITKIELV